MLLPLKDRRTSLVIFGLFLFLGFSQQGFGQSVAEGEKEVKKNVELKDNTSDTTIEEDLDTQESLKYVGNRLLFQVKKRLHLTTEEEEESEKKKKKKKVKLNIFGIEVEKT